MNTPSIEERLVEEFREHWGVLWTGEECDETYTKFEAWLTSALSQARQEGREERDKYWLEYIEGRAKFELDSSVYQIADMLKTDIDVARRKLSALTTEGE